MPADPLTCAGCRAPLGFDVTMAFQPIVDLDRGRVFAHEALVRGTDGAGAADVLARVTDDTRFAFDQLCRVRAVELAAALSLPGAVAINFMPNAVYEPAHCLRGTLAAAQRTGTPLDRLILEVTEGERIADAGHLRRILDTCKRSGLVTAIDDFGAGDAGLNLLAAYRPDIIKIDMELTRGIDVHRVRQAIVAAIAQVCRALSITPIAEGVQTEAEMRTLRGIGIPLQQGYLFAKPRTAALPEVAWPALPA